MSKQHTTRKGSQYEVTVPSVSDRIAQTAAAMVLERRVEPIFHPDSYGYRPGRSALDAVGMCRERCWKYNWAIDLDVQAFFDNVDHNLLVRAVERHLARHDDTMGAAICQTVAGSTVADR